MGAACLSSTLRPDADFVCCHVRGNRCFLHGFRNDQLRKSSREPFYRQSAKSAKDLHHPFGEAIDQLDFDSEPCFSWRLCDLAVEI
jgi:hypothetical protein